MIYCDDGKVYTGRLLTLDTNFYDVGISFDTEPIGINYRLNEDDSFLCCAPNKIITYNGNVSPVTYTENVPNITSVALHAGRLFATTGGDQSQLWFSDDLDPTNWNVSEFEGGYIELTDERGTLKKVIESNNYLYVIREYGISRVSGWGLQDEFTVRNLYLTTGKLYYNTAVLCGGGIIMLCTTCRHSMQPPSQTGSASRYQSRGCRGGVSRRPGCRTGRRGTGGSAP